MLANPLYLLSHMPAQRLVLFGGPCDLWLISDHAVFFGTTALSKGWIMIGGDDKRMLEGIVGGANGMKERKNPQNYQSVIGYRL